MNKNKNYLIATFRLKGSMKLFRMCFIVLPLMQEKFLQYLVVT
jgi:hypothetical protein